MLNDFSENSQDEERHEPKKQAHLKLVSSSKPKLLIIDDDPDFLNLLQCGLEEQFECIMAENGYAGLELFKTQAPDLILTDISMPKMDGIEFLNHMKQFHETSIIVVSGYDFSPDSYEQNIIEMEAVEQVSKPIDMGNIIYTIKKVLKLK